MMDRLQPIALCILAMLDFVFAYEVSKSVIRQLWYKRITSTTGMNRVKAITPTLRTRFEKLIEKRQNAYLQAGCSMSEGKWLSRWYMLLSVLAPMVVFRQGVIKALLMIFLIEFLRRRGLSNRRRDFEARFNQNLYKIYRFLYTQLTAGLSPIEILRHIHLAATDVEMRSAITAFTGAYFRTLNFSRASKELLERYPNKESEILLTILRQGIESGDSLELIQRQEEVMTQRYLDAVVLETERVQTKTILMIVAAGGILLAIMGLPLILQMMEALNALFL
jgi:hypothetical protein